MEKKEIYEFQLKSILTALELTARIHDCRKLVSCWDRDVMQAIGFTKNALEGNIDKRVGRFNDDKN